MYPWIMRLILLAAVAVALFCLAKLAGAQEIHDWAYDACNKGIVIEHPEHPTAAERELAVDQCAAYLRAHPDQAPQKGEPL